MKEKKTCRSSEGRRVLADAQLLAVLGGSDPERVQLGDLLCGDAQEVKRSESLLSNPAPVSDQE